MPDADIERHFGGSGGPPVRGLWICGGISNGHCGFNDPAITRLFSQKRSLKEPDLGRNGTSSLGDDWHEEIGSGP